MPVFVHTAFLHVTTVTYFLRPPRHAPHAKDTYKEAFHASQSRVLYSLFREDIKGQMKLPPKGGEEGGEEE